MTTSAATRSTQLYCGAQGLSNFENTKCVEIIQKGVPRHWGLAAFFAFDSFFGAPALVLASLAVVLPLGAPFFWLAALFVAVFSGAS